MRYVGEKHIVRFSDLAFTPTLVSNTENTYSNALMNISAEIAETGKRIILLAGPSASGKTTTANRICGYLSTLKLNAVRISLDDFYLPKRLVPEGPGGKKDYESVTSLDLKLLDECIADIIKGKDIIIPHYDFLTGERAPAVTKIKYDKNLLIIFEGINALNPALSGNLSQDRAVKIYISTQTNYVDNYNKSVLDKEDLRLARRLVRDYYYRGTDGDTTFDMWTDVIIGEVNNIKPYLPQADFVINSVHLYEPLLMRDYVIDITSRMKRHKHEGAAFAEKFSALGSLSPNYLPLSSMMREFFK